MHEHPTIAIAGRKRHGKDTLARCLTKLDPTYKIRYFAGRLKEVCGKVFCLQHHHLYDEEGKEANFYRPVAIDNYLPELERELGLKLPKLGLMANNPRQLLQFVGTDYVRKVQPDYWTMHLATEVYRLNYKVIIPDLRFHNELKFLESLGVDRTCRVNRPSKSLSDLHESEQQIPYLQVRYHLEVSEGDFELYSRFSKALLNDDENTLKDFTGSSGVFSTLI